MEKSCNSGTKKSKTRDTSLLDLVFAWSIQDILDNNLYKSKVKQIPDKFSSTVDYLNSFKQPLIEEIRADLCSGLESVAQAPSCEISKMRISRNYKPPKNILYEMTTKRITEIENVGGDYVLQSGDLIVLTTVRPRRMDDLFVPGETFLQLALVTVSDENEPWIEILLSRDISSELRRMKHGKLFATYLMNMTTYFRILAALNADPQSANLRLIQKVLQYDPAVDSDCSLCISEESIAGKEGNVLDIVGSFGLDKSQKNAVMSSVSMRRCIHQEQKVKLIWGPPGTGKTKTVASLLSVLLKLKCRTLTCAPTNIAVLQVAQKLLTLFLGSLEYDTYGLGDIVLYGNKDRMKIDDRHELADVFLEFRCKVLRKCLAPLTGWKISLESMKLLLEKPGKSYQTYVDREKAKNNDKEENDAEKKRENRKHGKEHINQLLVSNKKKDAEKEKIKDQARPSEEPEKLMTFEEFMCSKFYSLADRLKYCARNLYTHLPTSFIPLYVAKGMIRLVDLLRTVENAKRRASGYSELMKKRKEILSITKFLHERFPGLKYNGNIYDLCLSNACLVFCTASSSIKMKGNVEMVIIDEAAQLKECESAIPLQISGLKNVILIGDDRQLPAMVRSKISGDAKFGRSLFQRLVGLGKKKHLLNIQYRMHPSISLFPNEVFYEKRIVDGPNVKQKSYQRSFLKGDMYGSYSFINVANGKENFDKGFSPRNLKEAIVVEQIVAKLFRGHFITKQKISVGVISPYKGQVSLIQERIGKKYDNSKETGFCVSVRSVDGFQGGEEDVIIISTVRCNGNGSVGFLSNYQRTNVALTRARYCLWIVGSGATLLNSRTVWMNLVIDAKTRGCFHEANEDKDLSQTLGMSTQPYGKLDHSSLKLDLSSLKLEQARWKVLFTEDFKISLANIEGNKPHNKVKNMLIELSDGWHQPSSEKAIDIATNLGVAYELLQLYKVDEHLYLAWSVDILKEESKYTQVIKIWNILSASKIPKLVKDLNVIFGNYTVDFMNRCKYKSYEGNLAVPKSWPLHSVSRVDPAEYLSRQLAAMNIRDTNQVKSSSNSINIMKPKQKKENSMSYWIPRQGSLMN